MALSDRRGPMTVIGVVLAIVGLAPQSAYGLLAFAVLGPVAALTLANRLLSG